MEAETLKTLEEIRGLLYLILAVLSVGVFFLIMSSGPVFYSILKGVVKKDWKEQANEYYESGEFEKLVVHCRKREATHKNDPNVYYWQARVHHAQGDTEKATEFFAKVSVVAPDWYKGHVEPYFDT